MSFSFHRNRIRALSPSARRSPSPSPSHPPSSSFWQRRLLGDRSASPVRSVSPHPLPISPLVQRRISSGTKARVPYKGSRGWVTPIGSSPEEAEEAERNRRSRSLDTGLGDDSKLDDRSTVQASDTDDEVICTTPTTKSKERPSRKDRLSVSRSKAAQTTSSSPRKSRRSTATDDDVDNPPTFVDRCVTKMKTLINK